MVAEPFPGILSDDRTPEQRKRGRRWRFFQIVFVFAYSGTILDVITTAMGYEKTGAKYEQNPLGGGLIHDLGWIGLAALLTVLLGVCYFSCRVVYARMNLRWSSLLNTILVLVTAFRWLAVVTAVLYLMQPGR